MTVLKTIDADSLDGLPQPTKDLIADVVSEVRQAVLANELIELTLTVGHADLTEASNGVAQVVDIGADVLPANARVVAYDIDVTEAFAGGSVSACGLEIGGTTDPNGILESLELITDVPTAAELNAAKGISAHRAVHAGEQLGATFTPDGGNPLADLTAGEVTIKVLYAVLPTPAP